MNQRQQPPSFRARIMMAFLVVIITWGIAMSLVVDGVAERMLKGYGLPAEVVAEIASGLIVATGSLTLLGIVVFSFFARYLANSVSRPLQDLMAGVEALGRGDLQVAVTLTGEDEFARLGLAFNRMVERRRELDQLKSDFVATVSHELRTPVATILGFAELLTTQSFPAGEQREYLQIIQHKAEKLSQLMEELLDISRLEAGSALTLVRTRFSLPGLVHEYLGRYRQECRHHRFVLNAPEVPLEVEGDRLRIERVIDNLLSNAVKYSPGGGEITVALGRRREMVNVSFTDPGIGMSADQVERVFEKFYRVDSSDTAVGGVGLGLCIARNIVEAHGGGMAIESSPGQGSTVTFSLPVVAP